MTHMRGDSVRNRLALAGGILRGFPESALLLIAAFRLRREFAASQWGGA